MLARKPNYIGGGFAINPFGLGYLMDQATGATDNSGVSGNQGNGGGTGGGNSGATATADPPAGQQQGNQPNQPPNQGQTQNQPQLNEQQQALLNAVEQRVQNQVQPLQQRYQELDNRLNQMQAPRHQASQMFHGGAPNIRQGEDTMASRGYQFLRLAGYQQGSSDYTAEQCQFELEVSRRLQAYYRRQGFQGAGKRSGQAEPVLVPLSIAMLPDEFLDQEDKFAQELRQSMAAGTDGANADEMKHYAQRAGVRQNIIRQALSMFDDSKLGIFTEAGPKGEMIELIRAAEFLSRVGTTPVTLPPNGYLPFGAQTGAATGHWVGENQSITDSEQTTGRKELRARKMAALVEFPNELLRFGNPSVEAFIRSDLARVLALLADLAGLEGTGTATQPLGIINHPDIVSFTAGTTDTNGDTLEPDDPAGMIAEVEENNHDVDRDGFAWGMRSKMWKNIRTRRTDAVTADDGAGQWLFDANRADIANGAPAMLEGWPVVKSGQISNEREKGSSSDLTYVLGGIFAHMLVGRVGVLEFAMSSEGDTVFSNDQSKLRAIQHIDYLLRYPDAFVVADNIDMDLP